MAPARSRTFARLGRAAGAVVLSAAARLVSGQDVAGGLAAPSIDGDRLDSDEGRGATLARLRVGAFTISPQLRIGELAVDTNVFYRRERRTDFLASGGPGLGIAAVLGDHWRFSVSGNANYYFFLRNEDLRRWGGGGNARLDWKTTGTRAGVVTNIARVFSRPNFEVDRRVNQRNRRFGAYFDRNLGRLTAGVDATYTRFRIDEGEIDRGVDLARALGRNQYGIGLRLWLSVTPVTSVIGEGEFDRVQNALVTARDFDRIRAGIGIATDGAVKGRALVGVSRSRLRSSGESDIAPFFRVNLVQGFGTRVRFNVRADVEQTVSAFAVDGEIPTFDRARLTGGLQYTFLRRFSIRGELGVEKVKSLGLVRVQQDDGTFVTARRDDTAFISDVDLGIQLGDARAAAFVRYTTRESLFFEDLGIRGLQYGARLTYNPPF